MQACQSEAAAGLSQVQESGQLWGHLWRGKGGDHVVTGKEKQGCFLVGEFVYEIVSRGYAVTGDGVAVLSWMGGFKARLPWLFPCGTTRCRHACVPRQGNSGGTPCALWSRRCSLCDFTVERSLGAGKLGTAGRGMPGGWTLGEKALPRGLSFSLLFNRHG